MKSHGSSTTSSWQPISLMFLWSARGKGARFENCLRQNSQLSETCRLNWNAHSDRRKSVVPFGSQPMRQRWPLCTTRQSGCNHAWKRPTCSKGDSRPAPLMRPRRNAQRSQTLARGVDFDLCQKRLVSDRCHILRDALSNSELKSKGATEPEENNSPWLL